MVVSVFSPAPVTPGSDAHDPLWHLGTQERAVLSALAEDAGKVVSRRELARRIGVENLSERRCDSILVGVRRVLGPDAIRTVRSRGWMLQPHALAEAGVPLDSLQRS
jgi:DNA-binding response OmpR family regulator